MKRFLQTLFVLFFLGAGGAVSVALAGGDHKDKCDKCHPTTVTVTETAPGETVTVTVPGPTRTVERTVTETLPAVTAVETLPAETVVETQVETVVKPKVVVKTKWRTKVKWKTRTVTKLRKVCKPPPPRPCCEGAG